MDKCSTTKEFATHAALVTTLLHVQVMYGQHFTYQKAGTFSM